MYYLSGVGCLATEQGDIPYREGTILIVPPGVIHGSVSENGFVNISIGGDFNHFFLFDKIVVQHDNESGDGGRLAKLIYANRHAAMEYVASLCNAYANFLLQNAQYEDRVNQAVADIIKQTAGSYFDPQFSITLALRKSGYAQDYIRANFKRVTGLSPIEFLTKIRIDHGRKLFEIYGQGISVSEAALACGFEDPVYFSKRFKQATGVSPKAYQKKV